MREYNKLVRDYIPELIKADGQKAAYKVADQEEFLKYLKEKLLEEVNEFNQVEKAEELADILEVLIALGHYFNLDLLDIIKIAEKKRRTRGGFEKRYILLSVED